MNKQPLPLVVVDQEGPFVNIPREMLQHLSRMLEPIDLVHLAQTGKKLQKMILDTPLYKGEKARALFFTHVGYQHALLMNNDYYEQSRWKALQLSSSQNPEIILPMQFRAIKAIQQGDFSGTCAHIDSVAFKQKALKGYNFTPLLAMLKLETIKTKPAASRYFLNINNEETKFNYEKDYRTIHRFKLLALVSALIAGGCMMMPYLFASLAASQVITATFLVAGMISITCLSLASHFGTEHQRALHRFVLNEDFLQEDADRHQQAM